MQGPDAGDDPESVPSPSQHHNLSFKLRVTAVLQYSCIFNRLGFPIKILYDFRVSFDSKFIDFSALIKLGDLYK
jgi:hypothetical protein